MTVKIYISGISGNKEVKKRQQRVCMILDSKSITYELIDITEPGKETDKEFMQQNSNAKDAKHPLPPQIFNDESYCGDYDEFDLANENDELEKFLKVPVSASSAAVAAENGHVANGNTSSREISAEKDSGDQQVPESQEERRTETVETEERDTSEMAVDSSEEPVKEEVPEAEMIEEVKKDEQEEDPDVEEEKEE